MRARFDEAADVDAPPSRLSADGVYAAAFQRRRRRATAWTVCGTAVVALVAGLGTGLLGAPSGTPAPAQSAEGRPPGVRDGSIVTIAAADAEHLYAGVWGCTGSGGAAQCTLNLVGSDDGGRTWTVRMRNFDGDLYAPATGSLLRILEKDNDDPQGPKLLHVPWVSRDGGRTWVELRAGAGTMPQVPAGGWIQCAAPQRLGDPCVLIGADPVNARSAPLATQPDLDVDGIVGAYADGRLWVTGRERTGEHRPAVAVSRDGGRSWSAHVFTRAETGESPSDQYSFVRPASTDGVTGYTIISTPDPTDSTGVGPTTRATAGIKTLVFRTGDGGLTWQAVHPSQTLPRRYYQDADAYVAADGSHVVLTSDNPPYTWYTSTDGGNSYHPANQPGLGGALLHKDGARVLAAGPGAYLAFDDEALYQSADGLRWTRSVIRPQG
ncbi:glycoside hydrolase [Dactylosporangium sp. NBC_01737]|uniref:sialidase family protein n=1 Tax=Dactylosporangium sp. NBC_01737 TaxID=2975959 RepID=UPI002E116DF7|nr:glycoside hydrolase [Dactylosporangium sp. NBC_01737]